MPNINGTPNNDIRSGTAGDDYIYGLGGNDALSGLGGDDYIYGGDGNDTMTGDGGDDYLEGEAGSDALYGGAGADYLYGGTGADFLSGGDDNDDLSGGDGDDTLLGDAGNDILLGAAGNDFLYGGTGENFLKGGDGIDTAIFAGARSSYAMNYVATDAVQSWDFVSPDSFDHLDGVERLQFTDVHLALDLAGNAGFTVKLLAAVLGSQFVSNAGYVGIGLHLLDGGFSRDALVQAVIDVRLGQHASNAAFVDLVYTNLAGVAPSQQDAQPFIQMLESGQYTQVQLAEFAMDTSLNMANFDFAGLVVQGVAFEPY